MLDNKIVRLAIAQCVLEIIQPLVGEPDIHRIQHRNLLIHDDVGIVRHSVGDPVLTLEQVDFMVVNAYVANIVCYLHDLFPPKHYLWNPYLS